MKPHVLSWLEQSQPPRNYYQLLGRRLFDPDADDIRRDLRVGLRELLKYQTHRDRSTAQKACDLMTALGAAEKIFHRAEATSVYTALLERELANQWRSAGLAPGALAAWLSNDHQVHPAVLDRVVDSIDRLAREAPLLAPSGATVSKGQGSSDVPEFSLQFSPVWQEQPPSRRRRRQPARVAAIAGILVFAALLAGVAALSQLARTPQQTSVASREPAVPMASAADSVERESHEQTPESAPTESPPVVPDVQETPVESAPPKANAASGRQKSATAAAAPPSEQPPLLPTLEGHTGEISTLAFSHDGQWIISASFGTKSPKDKQGSWHWLAGTDQSIRLWNVSQRTEALKIPSGKGMGSIRCACLSDDNRRIVAAYGNGGVLRCYDAQSGALIRAFTPREEASRKKASQAVAIFPDGRRALSAGSDDEVRLWNLDTGEELLAMEHSLRGMWSVAISPDGRTFATAGSNIIILWDAATNQELQRWDGVAPRFVEGGDLVAYLDKTSREVRVRDLKSQQTTNRFAKLKSGRVFDLSSSRDGQQLILAAEDKTVRVWDVAAGSETARYGPHATKIVRVAASPNGRLIAFSDDSSMISLWDVPSDKVESPKNPTPANQTPVAKAPPKTQLPEQQLQPGARLMVPLPELGGSARSGGREPVQMWLHLPKNYDPKRSHPVLVFVPGSDDALQSWSEIFDGKNFIFLGVEYGPGEQMAFDPTTGQIILSSKILAYGDRHIGRNAVHALDLLSRETKIDKNNLVLVNATPSDESHQKLGHPAFALYVPIGNLSWNDSVYARMPSRRPVLWIGHDSSDPALPYLRKDGWDVTAVPSNEDFTKTPTSETARAQIREWFYRKLPLFASPYQLHQRIESTRNARGKLTLQTQLAKSWLDLPWIEDARKAVKDSAK